MAAQLERRNAKRQKRNKAVGLKTLRILVCSNMIYLQHGGRQML